jgi:hypothetical protein
MYTSVIFFIFLFYLFLFYFYFIFIFLYIFLMYTSINFTTQIDEGRGSIVPQTRGLIHQFNV